MRKASADPLSARILVGHGSGVLDAAASHCRQTVEKALKAYLVWRGIAFERVHNLTYLLDVCEADDPSFAGLREKAEPLTPFAAQVRYPGPSADLSVEDVRDALSGAEAVFAHVLALLPPGVQTRASAA
ncbi:MAG: HEPN domain-containing protein [Armatimonadetes bacterium]|nr:HEPN domain-containing protein [Armatimonadota bacterium]